jgi:RecA/RadA recombinase
MNEIFRQVDPDLRANIRKQIVSDYGQHTILAGNRMPEPRRMPSRSIALDYIMGGGYPFGVMTRLWGAYSTGKSSTLFNAFWAAQNYGVLREERLLYLAALARVSGQSKEAKRLTELAKFEAHKYAGGLKLLYVCSEKVFDSDLAIAAGVDLSEDRFEISLSTRIEEIGDIVQKALLGYHVIAVDSTTDTISIDELAHKEGIFADLPMKRAKRWGINMDWWRDRMTPDNILIYTSQVQSKPGTNTLQRQAAEQAPGGHKLNHEASIILHFMKGGWLKRKKDGDGLEPVGDEGGEKGAFGKTQPAGGEVVVRCEKNKTARDYRTCLLQYDKVVNNYDRLFELEKFAKYFKVVKPTTAKSSWYLLPDGSKTQTLSAALRDDESLRHQVEDVVLRCAADASYEDRLLRSGNGPSEEELAPAIPVAA